MSAATDASGTEKYWFDGLPQEVVENSGDDTGSSKYWYDGLPADFLFPASGGNGPRDLFLLGVG